MKKFFVAAVTVCLLLTFSSSVLAEEQRVDINQLSQIEKEAIEKEKKNNIRGEATKKYPDAIKELDYRMKDVIFQKLIEFENQNPEASQDEINDYFMKLCKQNKWTKKSSDTSAISASSVDSYFYNVVEGMASLNPDEQVLYNQDPSRGFKALIAGDESADYTAYWFGYNGHNNKSDAFRHAGWNIWIVGFTGSVGWAKSWTDAHETGAVNNPAIEFNMDINNNYYGRVQAINANISTSSTITATRTAIVNIYKSGNLQYIYNGTRVNFVGKDSDFVGQ